MIINCLLYNNNSNFGYREYVRNLLFLFSSREELFLFRFSQKNYILEFTKSNNISVNCIFLKDYLWRIKLLFLPAIIKSEDNIFLHTFNYGPIFFLKRSRHFLVIHDLQFLHKSFENSFFFKLQRFFFLHHHHRLYNDIIFISNFSKYDYVLNFNLRRNLSVIPNYLPKEKYNLVSKFGNFEDFDFILCVSSSKWYKRLDYLITEFEKLNITLEQSSFRKFKLVLISNIEINSNDVIVLENISQAELNYLYTAASCVVIPSLFEGFCFPYVESILFNKKLFVHDMPISREITNVYPNVEFFNYETGELAHLIYSNFINGTLCPIKKFDLHYIKCFIDSNFQLKLYDQIKIKYI